MVGTRINKPLKRQSEQGPGSLMRFLAKLWPWPLVIFLVWVVAQFVVGYFFNEFLQKNAYLGLLLIVGLLPLSVFSAHAYDIHTQKSHVVPNGG